MRRKSWKVSISMRRNILSVLLVHMGSRFLINLDLRARSECELEQHFNHQTLHLMRDVTNDRLQPVTILQTHIPKEKTVQIHPFVSTKYTPITVQFGSTNDYWYFSPT